MSRRKHERGVTLMEMVVIIVVMGLAIPVLLSNWANVAWRSAGSEGVADASFLAQSLLEEIISRRFDENLTAPRTAPALLGTDATENPAERSTFDDVDDYASATDGAVRFPQTGYERSVSVRYAWVDPEKRWQECPVSGVCNQTVTDCAACSDCCYKKVSVSVRRTDNIIGTVTVSTIVAGY